MAEPRDANEASRPPLATRVLVATGLAAALAPLNSTMLSVALRDIGASLGESEATLTRSLVTPYLVASVVMQAPGGKLGDMLGHRRALALGQLVFLIGALVAVLAPGLVALSISRVAMASAGALIVPSAMALLRTELPAEVRGRAFGAFGATMSLAAALGPLIGGQLTAAFGWRSVFAVNLVVLPISALLARGGHAPTAAPKLGPRASFDWVGSVLLACSLASWVLAVGRGRSPDVRLLGVGLVLLVAFVLHERRQAAPVVELSLLGNLPYLAGGLLIALHNLAMYALLFELPTVCGIVLGAGAQRTGPLLVSIMAPMVVCSLVAGRLTDALGPRVVATMGTVATAAGFGILLASPVDSLLSLVPGLVVVGGGLGLAMSPAQSASMGAVPPEKSGVAAGMTSTLRYLGGIVGTLVLSLVMVPTSEPAVALASHRTALTIFLVAACAAMPFAWLLSKTVGRRG